MEKKIKDYKDLEVWQISRRLVLATYELCKSFPKNEEYGLRTQMQRSVISIPSNIAEGYLRGGRKEYTYFLGIAAGSAAELDTQLILAHDLKFIGSEQYTMANALLLSVRKMLFVLRRKLQNK